MARVYVDCKHRKFRARVDMRGARDLAWNPGYNSSVKMDSAMQHEGCSSQHLACF